VYFGGSTDKAVPGDYNGYGTTDVGASHASSGLWQSRVPPALISEAATIFLNRESSGLGAMKRKKPGMNSTVVSKVGAKKKIKRKKTKGKKG